MRYYENAEIEQLTLPGGTREVISKDLSFDVGLEG